MNLNNYQKIESLSLINSPKFAYLYGYFVADGCYYKDGRNVRFEFSNGTSIKEELGYSFRFMNKIKSIIEITLQKNLPKLRKRGNRYVLSFRSEKLADIFKNYFKLTPGEKSFSINIPSFYVNTSLERYFWLGVLDGDGMVARKSRKISLEMGSKKLIEAFKDFLERRGIMFKYSERILRENKFYRANINSNFFKKFCSEIGFSHPRKKLWLLKHLEMNDFYKNNIVNINGYALKNKIINYEKIFSSSTAMVVNGKDLVKEYKLKYRGKNNRKFDEILQKLNSKKISKIALFKVLSKYRWKMGKGSTNSVRMPLYFNTDILDIARFVRLRNGCITTSQNYIESFNLNPHEIISKFEQIFDIKPKYTCKGEPLFCSGILALFFSKIIKSKEKELVLLPKWHQNLE
ncbi:hypothetical protein HYY71_06595 [Candidatus Woesearchaeota archaeon]|nr:hypothetical protein [Candidatus Woesearchaeota archaeon]